MKNYQRFVYDGNGNLLYILEKSAFNNVLPQVAIIDVNIIVPNKVVEVTFVNGDKQKAVCHDGDTFSLEQAISVCVGKHTYGHAGYNRIIRNGLKLYERKVAAENKAEADRVEAERLAAKREKKHADWVERCRKKDMERQIEIQKEAYLRAMRELNPENVAVEVKNER